MRMLLKLSDTELARVGGWLQHEKLHHRNEDIRNTITLVESLIDEWSYLRDYIENEIRKQL